MYTQTHVQTIVSDDYQGYIALGLLVFYNWLSPQTVRVHGCTHYFTLWPAVEK